MTNGLKASFRGKSANHWGRACMHRAVGAAAGLLIVAASFWNAASTAHGAEEHCAACEHPISVTGDFTHHAENMALGIQGAATRAADFRENIQGKNFSVSVANLPEGRYKIAVGLIETKAIEPGERLFDATSDETVLADDFDIIAAAGGRGKACYILAEIDHLDDTLRGPLKVDFVASRGNAKLNTCEVRDANDAVVVAFCAAEIAEPFTGDATRIPDLAEAPIWRDYEKPVRARVNDLIRRMSLDEKVAQLRNDAPSIPRLGLPAYNYWNEALHGVANNGVATVFPEPVGMAATWNPELMRREGRVVGVEGRAKHNHYASQNGGDSKWWTGLTFWTPNVNLFRDPRWGRGQETYGEDPFLTSVMSVEFVKGMQGDDPRYMLSMACAKHYAVHSGPELDRHRFNAEPRERDLYEMYLPQFEAVVKQGQVGGVMGAYNALNGVPCCADPFLLDNLLRKQWGFEGYVVSDCGGIRDIWGRRQHHYVDTPEEAAAVAVKAGCNLCCGGDYNALIQAVQTGLLSEADVDQALFYTLWTRFRLGLFDPPEQVPYAKYTIADNDTPEHSEVALEVARQSLVLLKNDGILPLPRDKYRTIAVIGPNGASKSMLEGNYHGSASHPVSILDGIKQLAGDDAEVGFALGSPVTTRPGTAPWSGQDNATDRPVEELRAEALELAAGADLIVYAGGITPAQEGESFDRPEIELPVVQQQLVKALHATGKPVVMVNCSGSAMALLWESEHLPAILQAWYPGQQGGRAVAEALFGQINPSGHLPVTFYRATADLPEFTDYSFANRTYRYFSGQPLYAFGHGLSYTQFDYRDGKLAANEIPARGTAHLSFTIENSGSLAGADIAQVYFRHVAPSVPQAKLALCAFERVALEHGESRTVTLDIPVERLRYWDAESDCYVVEPGAYELLIAAASDDIRLTIPLKVVDNRVTGADRR
ncbi:MAG: glycosyl hydrolase [Planctomycetaceae bacterium]|nr:glycosyl hydrolase [Planctomycetaceae bacterium]